MADETTDISNCEQMVIVIRWITRKFIVQEEFIGLYEMSLTDSATIAKTILDVLTRLNLPLSKVCGQCYDGASCMSGCKSGVAKRITDLEPRALYIHCYGHALNLEAGDAIKQSKLMQDALDTTREITKLVKSSPKREAMFKDIKKANEAECIDLPSKKSAIRVLCPTRWTVRAEALGSVINNYSSLLETFEAALETTRDTDTKARIRGVAAEMTTFKYLFGNVLAEKISRHTDNLSKTLQTPSSSAATGQDVAKMTLTTLMSMRSDECYDLFWNEVALLADQFDVEEPQLPRRRRPKRYNDGLSEGHHPETVKDLYRQYYFEAIDAVIACIKDRFNQPGYITYKSSKELLLNAAKQEDYTSEFEAVSKFYQNELDQELLKTQLVTFGQTFTADTSTLTIYDLQEYFESLTSAQCTILSQVCKLMEIILIMPATNSTSERSFSALRHVKTYLRNTMSQRRLNDLMILHVQKIILTNLI